MTQIPTGPRAYRPPTVGDVETRTLPTQDLTSEAMVELVNLANYCRGRGVTAVVPHSLTLQSSGTGTFSQTIRFKYYSPGTSFRRRWEITCRAYTAATIVVFDVDFDGADIDIQGSLSASAQPFSTYTVYEDFTASEGIHELGVVVSAPSATIHTFEIQSIACYEVPRFQLAKDTTDYGIQPRQFESGADIYSNGQTGARGIIETLHRCYGMRGSLLNISYPSSLVANTSTYVQEPIYFPIAPRVTRNRVSGANGEGELRAWAYCKVTGGSGTIRLTNNDGTSWTGTFTSSTGEWVELLASGDQPQFLTDVLTNTSENWPESSGNPVPDYAIIEVRANSGTAAQVLSFCIFDAP